MWGLLRIELVEGRPTSCQTFGLYPVDGEELQKDLQQGSDLARSVSGKLTHILGKEETRDWLRGKCDSSTMAVGMERR